MWPDVLEEVKKSKRMAWMILSQNAQVLDVSAGVLTLGVPGPGVRTGFVNSGSDDLLRQAVKTVLRVDLKVDTIVDPSATGAAATTAPGPRSDDAPVDRRAASFDEPSREPDRSSMREAPSDGTARPATAHVTGPPAPDEPSGRAQVTEARRRAKSGSTSERPDPDASVDVDRDETTDDGASQTELLTREFGAQLIDEYGTDRGRR